MACLKTYSILLLSLIITHVHGQEKIVLTDSLHKEDSLWNIKLHEIKVIAQENRTVSSSSVISKEAIRHVQPFSLSDLMQLLPGGITPKISFKSPTYLTIRHLGNNPAMNSLGTGISIDGVRLSVNSDLQQQASGYKFDHQAAQTGTDTRTIPTDNIETLEVIRGIPSVRYGDITSGMVIVRTRQEARPYSASIRITPEIKAFNAGKGWQTGSRGILNLNVGYTRANSDISDTENLYHRLSLQTGYIIHLKTKRPVTLETGADADITFNRNPAQLTLQPGEYIKANRQSFRFRFSGKWQSPRQLLSEINWKTTVEYGNSVLKNNHFLSGVYSVGTSAQDEGEHQGFFIPPQHWESNRLLSTPISITTGLSANIYHSDDRWNSNTLFGAEWTCEGNEGDGRKHIYHTPDLPSQKNYRFRNLPYLQHYAIYLEEKFQSGQFTLEGGIRLTSVSVKGMTFYPTLEPRVNLNYLVLQRKNEGIRLLRLRGGIGLLRKMPTLGFLFREPEYKNFINYRDQESNLAVLTTYISQLTGTTNLKLPENLKVEMGISGLFGDFSFDITGFYERLKQGFRQNTTARPVSYRIYNNPNETGQNSEYHDGEVYINDHPAGYFYDTTFITHANMENSLYEHKGGIEFVCRSNYIPSLATTFVLDGAWIILRSEDKSITPEYSLPSSGNRSYPHCAFFENNASYTLLQRFNTTLRAVTEITSLHLTGTIALQSVWLEKSQRKVNHKTQKHIYQIGVDGNRMENGIYNDSENNKYLDPVYYMDTQGTIHPFTDEMANDPNYQSMVKEYYSRTFMQDSYSPYFLLNLRITKEIGQHLILVFFANNLAKINPKRYKASSGQNMEMNPPAFFGAEVQIKL